MTWLQSFARWVPVILLLATGPWSPLPTRAKAVPQPETWREFNGTWSATGKREVISLGGERQASIADFNGSLLLSGPERPSVGFGAEAIVLIDSATGMVGRAVWTDDRGEHVFSELTGERTGAGSHIHGTLVGGTGRYAGITGDYDFSWRVLVETEDGVVQGQSMDLKGRFRIVPSPGAATSEPAAGGSQ